MQSHVVPDWDHAFARFHVLAGPPESKSFELRLKAKALYRFCLLANPVVSRDGRRLGLQRESLQRQWLERKLRAAGAEVLSVDARDNGLQRSQKEDGSVQTHQAVRFEGVLRCVAPEALQEVVCRGIGPAKGYGFGLLSLALIRAV
jgi:CRISPR system Cascade subunit CasE